jgi:hypothetical protein
MSPAVSNQLPPPPRQPNQLTNPPNNQTPLQQHILFWDRDADGQIYPQDTYAGFRELGFSVFFSLLAAVLINGSLSYPTRLAVSWWPDWVWWRVWVGGVHKGKVSSFPTLLLFLGGVGLGPLLFAGLWGGY